MSTQNDIPTSPGRVRNKKNRATKKKTTTTTTTWTEGRKQLTLRALSSFFFSCLLLASLLLGPFFGAMTDPQVDVLGDTLFGLPLSTHSDRELDADATEFFMYEGVIAAIAVFFCRMTIRAGAKEPLLVRLAFALALAFLAWNKKPYTIIVALQIFSYLVPLLVFTIKLDRTGLLSKSVSHIDNGINNKTRTGSVLTYQLIRLLLIGVSGCASLVLSHLLLSDDAIDTLAAMTPAFVKRLALYLIPIDEMTQAYQILKDFVDEDVLHIQLSHLLFVTFNFQIGMGYLGIAFLKQEQERRNQLVRMDMTGIDDDVDDHKIHSNGSSSASPATPGMNGHSNKASPASLTSSDAATPPTKDYSRQLRKSRRFQRGAVPFILGAAIPYMFQIIAFGNMNMYAFSCFQHAAHRAVRLSKLFSHDSHLVSMTNDSPMSPDGTF